MPTAGCDLASACSRRDTGLDSLGAESMCNLRLQLHHGAVLGDVSKEQNILI